MASIIDYMLQTDAQLAKNRAQNLQNKLAPVQTIISAQNAAYRANQLTNSSQRWNSLSYLLRSLPAGAKSFVLQNPAIADKMAQQMLQGDQGGALNTLKSSMQQADVANRISSGSNQDFQKSTHTTTDINQVIAGKNAETTLNAIKQIAPSIAKFSGYKGKATGILDSIESGLGFNTGEDYKNYNNFKNSLLPQVASQLRQFYGSSIQPSEMAKKEDQLKPIPGENAEQYLTRLNQMSNILSAELEQRKQTYTDVFGKEPLTTQPATSALPTTQGKDFGQMLFDSMSTGGGK